MPKFIDITGKRYAELIVEKLFDCKINNRPAWLCLCDCGLRKIVPGASLKNGDVKCCGRHKTKFYSQSVSERSKIQNRKYPKETDTKSRMYTLWRAMLMRCNNSSHEAYERYGGSGIKVCAEWTKYQGFIDWATQSGYQPHLTIDRKDNFKGYSPDNCRWATQKEQSHNRKRGLVSITAFNQTKSLIDWVNDPRCQITLSNLRKRIYAGHQNEFALTATEKEMRCATQQKKKA